MHLIVVREVNTGDGTGLLRYALSTAPLHGVILEGLRHLWRRQERTALVSWTGRRTPEDSSWVLPRGWQVPLTAEPGRAVFYEKASDLETMEGENPDGTPWVVIANGRFAAYSDPWLLQQVLAATRADCLAVTVAPELMACQEQVRLTPDHKVVGYRRLYADAMSLTPVPVHWPHYLLVRSSAWNAHLRRELLSGFDVWVESCRAAGLRCQGVAVGGWAHDLESEEGILALCQVALRRPSGAGSVSAGADRGLESADGNGSQISPEAQWIGPVAVGREVTIEAGAVIVGPAVLCDGSVVGRDAIVDSAVVGAGVSVRPTLALRGRVVTGPELPAAPGPAVAGAAGAAWESDDPHRRAFRTWPWFSYARCLKRIADVIAAVCVLILFAPVIPVIALAIKFSSPGPVLFRDKRQGLHGRPFFCIKFRTMRPGADKIQDKLRFVCEVDGPQFKMADDPRITTVGRFLRETYLDEIPQFFNVLCGQMSVVGPRPSPESENRLCPAWRDARLSVRPGITGLWQVFRTREPWKDFQEWIYYDTQYVRDFSFGLDLWICWRTFTRMVGNFVRQF